MNSSSNYVISNVTELLTYVAGIIDPIATGQIISNLTNSEKSDLQFMSDLFCNDQGNFVPSLKICYCDLGFFDSHCQTPGRKYWDQGWTALQIFVTFAYIILALMAWKNLRKNWKMEYGGFWKKVKRLCRTPKYLVIINVFILSATRIVYVAVDPYRQRLIFSRKADVILCEIVFSAATSVFYILLIVWIGLYSAFNSEISYQDNINSDKHTKGNLQKENEKHMRYFEIIKEIIIILIFFIYPLQIAFSYIRGSRVSNRDLLNIFVFLVFALVIFFILVFAYFTCKLKINLSKSYEIPLSNNNKKGEVLDESEDYDDSKVDVNDEILFYGKLKEKSVLTMIVKNLINPERAEKYPKNLSLKNKNGLENIREENEDSDEDSDFELEYENEMININLDIFDTSNDAIGDLCEKRSHDSKGIEIEKIYSKEKEESANSLGYNSQARFSEKKNYVLTKNDMNVLNKIFRISYLIIGVAVFLTFIGILIEQRVILASPSGTITYICFVFIFELLTIAAIFWLFISDINSDEYNNLKVIGDIENYLKTNRNKNLKLKFDEIKDTQVFQRLKSFMNLKY